MVENSFPTPTQGKTSKVSNEARQAGLDSTAKGPWLPLPGVWIVTPRPKLVTGFRPYSREIEAVVLWLTGRNTVLHKQVDEYRKAWEEMLNGIVLERVLPFYRGTEVDETKESASMWGKGDLVEVDVASAPVV
jgi:hypothetical protein